MIIGLRICILFFIFSFCNAQDIPNCNFEDTVDLTNAQKLANGSYLYGNNVLVTPDQVGIYNYEELYDGERVPIEPHPRGCVCKERNCIRFCCHHTKEEIKLKTRQCSTLKEERTYVPHINVLTTNGTVQRRNVFEGFTIIQAAVCEFRDVVPPKADIWAFNGKGSITVNANNKTIELSKKGYCLTPGEGISGRMELSVVLCPQVVPVSQKATYIGK